MSARDARKSIPLRLEAAGFGALVGYARANGERALAAAARRAVRAAIGLAVDRPPATIAAHDRPRALRVQLEPALRAALANAARAGETEAHTLARLVASRTEPPVTRPSDR